MCIRKGGGGSESSSESHLGMRVGAFKFVAHTPGEICLPVTSQPRIVLYATAGARTQPRARNSDAHTKASAAAAASGDDHPHLTHLNARSCPPIAIAPSSCCCGCCCRCSCGNDRRATVAPIDGCLAGVAAARWDAQMVASSVQRYPLRVLDPPPPPPPDWPASLFDVSELAQLSCWPAAQRQQMHLPHGAPIPPPAAGEREPESTGEHHPQLEPQTSEICEASSVLPPAAAAAAAAGGGEPQPRDRYAAQKRFRLRQKGKMQALQTEVSAKLAEVRG